MKRSQDRKKHIVRQLDRLNVAHEFIDAIDGQEMSDQEIEACGGDSFPPWSSLNARRLMRGEIGCLLSHLTVYKKMIDEDIEGACVFEDDVILEEDLGMLLKNRWFFERPDYELLLLGHSGQCHDFSRGVECSSDRENVFSRYHIAKPIECPYGTFGYIIKKPAAIKLLRHAYPLRMPMDMLTGHSPAMGVKLRVVTPSIVTIDEALFKSTIREDATSSYYHHFQKARRLKTSLKNKYPVLRTIQERCLILLATLSLKLRKAGHFDWDTHADKRYFQKKAVFSPPRAPNCEMESRFEYD